MIEKNGYIVIAGAGNYLKETTNTGLGTYSLATSIDDCTLFGSESEAGKAFDKFNKKLVKKIGYVVAKAKVRSSIEIVSLDGIIDPPKREIFMHPAIAAPYCNNEEVNKTLSYDDVVAFIKDQYLRVRDEKEVHDVMNTLLQNKWMRYRRLCFIPDNLRSEFLEDLVKEVDRIISENGK